MNECLRNKLENQLGWLIYSCMRIGPKTQQYGASVVETVSFHKEKLEKKCNGPTRVSGGTRVS